MKALGKGSVASIIEIGLQIAWILLWVAAGGLVIALATYAGLQLLATNGVIQQDLLAGGEGRVAVDWRFVNVSVEFDEPETFAWPYVIPAAVAGAVAIAGGLVIVWRLKRLFGNFASGEPFSLDNAGHLRVIWIALLVMEISRYVISALMKLLIIAIGPPPNIEVNINPPLNPVSWAAILILIVLAEVFQEGARLREDEKLTI
jgi:hypothetical protein